MHGVGLSGGRLVGERTCTYLSRNTYEFERNNQDMYTPNERERQAIELEVKVTTQHN